MYTGITYIYISFDEIQHAGVAIPTGHRARVELKRANAKKYIKFPKEMRNKNV